MRPPSVLVIEDEATTRDAIAAALKSEGYQVHVAADAAEGMRRARTVEPMVVLADLGLPGIDGWDVIQSIRELPLRWRPRIIVMSGFSDARSRQLAFERGCDEYVVKTEGDAAIVAAVRTFVARVAHTGVT